MFWCVRQPSSIHRNAEFSTLWSELWKKMKKGRDKKTRRMIDNDKRMHLSYQTSKSRQHSEKREPEIQTIRFSARIVWCSYIHQKVWWHSICSCYYMPERLIPIQENWTDTGISTSNKAEKSPKNIDSWGNKRNREIERAILILPPKVMSWTWRILRESHVWFEIISRMLRRMKRWCGVRPGWSWNCFVLLLAWLEHCLARRDQTMISINKACHLGQFNLYCLPICIFHKVFCNLHLE